LARRGKAGQQCLEAREQAVLVHITQSNQRIAAVHLDMDIHASRGLGERYLVAGGLLRCLLWRLLCESLLHKQRLAMP
jgi:hypothetical protein